jgi:hypothetical protein
MSAPTPVWAVWKSHLIVCADCTAGEVCALGRDILGDARPNDAPWLAAVRVLTPPASAPWDDALREALHSVRLLASLASVELMHHTDDRARLARYFVDKASRMADRALAPAAPTPEGDR